MLEDIREYNLDQLEEAITRLGEKKFRARQVYEWLWKKSAVSFDEMTNLSLKLRDDLKNEYRISPITTKDEQLSSDGTIKSAFQLHDDHLIEGVLIPSDDRMTACVSSQVGCSLSCKFCATGYMKRMRNLTAGEIYDQVVNIDRQSRAKYGQPLSNIVFMGMGEPLLNYKNLLTAIDRITSPDGLHMAAKRITVSTAGIEKMIRKLGDDQVRFNLALSLHAANDEKRNQIMPINESNTLENLAAALLHFKTSTGNPVTLEYILFYNFNDGDEDAEQLTRFARKVDAKVNIIEYNPIEEADFINTTDDRLTKFARILQQHQVRVTVRRSRGKDIDAACGQLANKNKTVK